MHIQAIIKLLSYSWNHPARLWNLLKSAIFPYFSIVPYAPITADIETTLICNLACIMCHRLELAKRRKVMNISLENFKKIIDDMPSLIQVKLQGMGEPFLTPDFFDMIRYAKSKDIITNIVSNGKIMNSENARKTIESGLDRLYFSVDSADSAQYAAIRVGGKLKTVLENIAGFMEERKRLGAKKPIVGIFMLLFQRNLNQVRSLIDIAKQTGVDEMHIQTEITDRGKEKWKTLIASLRVQKKSEIDRTLDNARQYAKKQGVRLSIHSYVGGLLKKTCESTCQWPWKSLYITSQGDVSPCCIIADPNVIGLGNIYEEGFQNLWNNKNYQEFREQLLNRNIPSACQSCYGREVQWMNTNRI